MNLDNKILIREDRVAALFVIIGASLWGGAIVMLFSIVQVTRIKSVNS